VRDVRKQRGETLEQVAHRIARMDAKYLGEIEHGWHAPSISTAKRIADALQVALAELSEGLWRLEEITNYSMRPARRRRHPTEPVVSNRCVFRSPC
jgi:transcriptional regulator with XRE-family HTH domain